MILCSHMRIVGVWARNMLVLIGMSPCRIWTKTAQPTGVPEEVVVEDAQLEDDLLGLRAISCNPPSKRDP